MRTVFGLNTQKSMFSSSLDQSFYMLLSSLSDPSRCVPFYKAGYHRYTVYPSFISSPNDSQNRTIIGSCLSEELSCTCSEVLPLNRETGHSRTVATCCRLILVLEEEAANFLAWSPITGRQRIQLFARRRWRTRRTGFLPSAHWSTGLAQTLTARCGTKESLPPIQLTISNAYH